MLFLLILNKNNYFRSVITSNGKKEESQKERKETRVKSH